MPPFDDVFQMDDARAAGVPSATASGVPPVREMRSAISWKSAGRLAAALLDELLMASVAPFRSWRPSISTPLIRVYAEKGMKCASCSGHVAAAQTIFLFRENDNRAALRRFVGQARELRGIGQFARP